MAANVIRNIRQMPFLHRGEGFCPLERMREQRFGRLIVSCLTVLNDGDDVVDVAMIIGEVRGEDDEGDVGT